MITIAKLGNKKLREALEAVKEEVVRISKKQPLIFAIEEADID